MSEKQNYALKSTILCCYFVTFEEPNARLQYKNICFLLSIWIGIA